MGTFFGIAFLIMAMENAWWYGRLWWRLLGRYSFWRRVAIMLVGPIDDIFIWLVRGKRPAHDFDPLIPGAVFGQLGAGALAFFGMFVSTWRPFRSVDIVAMTLIDLFLLYSTVYKLLPDWTTRGCSRRYVAVQLMARFGFIGATAAVCIYGFGWA